MFKLSRVIFAAAFAVGIVSVSFGAATSVSRPDGLKELTIDTASRVTTTVTTYAKKIEFSVSDEIATTLGAATMTDFPVLVRLSSAAVENYDASAFAHNGRDLYFEDENGTALSFELDTFDSAGETLVWVKIPSLSASTKFTCYYGGPENLLNEPTDVWTGYLGVWHFNGQENGVTPNATANAGLDGSSGQFTPLSGANTPFGSAAVQAVQTINVQDYEPMYNVGKRFSASGWFKVPAQDTSRYSTFITKKSGLSWDATSGWYLEMSQSKTKMTLIPSSGATAAYGSVPDVTANWNYFTITHDNGSTKVYLNGSTSPVISQNSAINVSSTMFKMLASGQQGDEYRLSKSTWSALRTSLEYKSMKNADFLSNSGSSAMDATAPVFETPVVQVASAGSATMTFTVTDGEGEVSALVGGEKTYVGAIGTDITLNEPKTVDITIDENACVEVGVYGINTKGTEVTKFATGAAMNAAVEAVVTDDANERGLIPGVFTVSRPNGVATDLPIIVNLSWEGGSAVQGKNYLGELPASVTIPAGATSTTVVVTPLRDAESDNDETIILKVAAGAYKSGATATMKILNLVTDPNYNTWVAVADGLASDAANWSKGVPQSGDKILFDPQFSTANCEWDGGVNGLSTTVAEWMQAEGFTGTVTIDTEFSGTALTISGDAVLSGGKWSHRGNYNNYGAEKESNTSKLSSKRWCLNVQIGGNLTVGAGASIDVSGKGFGHPGSQSAPCYGGYCYNKDQSCAPYGSITEPFDPGMGCRSQGDQNKSRSGIGGGAVKLVVGGDVIVNGSISALGNVDLNVVRSGGTGGSIWIDANQISGTGTINASGCPPSNYTSDQGVAIGSGGRIALYTKSALAISRDKLFCSGSSYSGTGGSKTKVGSCGTIYIKDPSTSNGVLLLKQDSSIITVNSANSAVPLLEDMTLDGIEFRGRAVLAVETGKTLTLPGGFASVTSDSTTIGANGISYRGGVINIGADDQTISGWMLEPVSNFNFAADVALSNYGAIGIIKRNICGTGDAPIPPRKVSFAVAGDLSVDATSAVDVGNVVGYSNYGSGQRAGWYGGWTTYYDKNGNQTGAHENTYGSVFDPQDFGSSPTRSFLAGGAINMAVIGNLDLEGRVTASGLSSDNTTDGVAPSSGGSVKMSIGSLTGTGSITACAGAGRYAYAGGGAGGRIAIKLTDAKAAIPDTIVVNAGGSYGYAFNAKATKLGSAGTVYIETAADGAKGGTITISNWKDHSMSEFTSATVFPTTPIVAYNNGDAVADFKNAKLVVTNNAIAEVSVADLRMWSLKVAEGSKLDLFGNTLTVKSAKLGDTNLAAGTYAAGDVALGDFVSDFVGGGSLVVTGSAKRGLTILFR